MSSPEYNALLEYYAKLEISISLQLSSIADELTKYSTQILSPEQRNEILYYKNKQEGAKKLLEIVTPGVKQAKNAFIFDTLLEVANAKGNRAMKDLVTNIKQYCHEEYRKLFPKPSDSNSPGDEYHVFISYGHESETDQFVDQLKRRLEGLHLKVFIDRTSIAPGDIWPLNIANALHSCKAFVAVLTKKYVKSLYCRGELFQAKHVNKKIFTAVRESGWNQEPSGKSVQAEVGSIQYASVQDGANYEKQLYKLVKSISRHFEPPPPVEPIANHQPPVEPVANHQPPVEPVANHQPTVKHVVKTAPTEDVLGRANDVADGPERSGGVSIDESNSRPQTPTSTECNRSMDSGIAMAASDRIAVAEGIDPKQLDQPCSRELLFRISKLLPNWMEFADLLHITRQEINGINSDPEYTYLSKSYRMLQMWYDKSVYTERCHYRALIEASRELGHGTVAGGICKIIKENPPSTAHVTVENPPSTAHVTVENPPSTARVTVANPPSTAQVTVENLPLGPASDVYTEKDFESLSCDNVLELVNNDTILDGDDLAEIHGYLEKESANWNLICTKLHVSSNSIQGLATSNKTNEVCLSDALTEWLKLNYNFQEHGKPTWRKVAESVFTVNMKLFLDIARQHSK